MTYCLTGESVREASDKINLEVAEVLLAEEGIEVSLTTLPH